MDIAVLGIDLGKNICSVVGLDDDGRVLVRRRLKRWGLVEFAGRSPGCVVAMEACCGAHYLGRQLAAQGVVALANKLARIAWAVLVRGRGFDAAHVAA